MSTAEGVMWLVAGLVALPIGVGLLIMLLARLRGRQGGSNAPPDAYRMDDRDE